MSGALMWIGEYGVSGWNRIGMSDCPVIWCMVVGGNGGCHPGGNAGPLEGACPGDTVSGGGRCGAVPEGGLNGCGAETGSKPPGWAGAGPQAEPGSKGTGGCGAAIGVGVGLAGTGAVTGSDNTGWWGVVGELGAAGTG